MKPISRREFIISAGACSAITLAAPFGCNAAQAKTPFDGRRKINPAIDNLSVVCGINPAMVKGNPSSWDMDGQNSVIDQAQVEKTLDAMASTLAGTDSAETGWKKIFQKPAQKEWRSVKAAIKVNCIALNHPRIAVVNKVCIELHHLGVRPENIIIYDGVHNAASFYGLYTGKGLPARVVVSDKYRALGGTVKTVIPDAKKRRVACAKALAENAIDIIVNIAVNKGHSQRFGGTTLTMKNHAGTFDPKPLHTGGGMDYLIAFNKSDAILGVETSRQQLCIVDSLWGALKGPGGPPDKRLDRLVMGTLSPIVDFQTAKKIREPLLGTTHSNIERFVTEFGYRLADVPEMTTVTI